MSTATRGWRDALLGIALFSALTTFCDPAPAAFIRTTQESTIMATPHSQGPFHVTPESPTGYSTIHDHDGRRIGAALTGNDCHARGLSKDTVEANGRLFAASHSLCVALTGYMNAVDDAQAGGEFTDEIIEKLADARQDAIAAFAILLGSAS